MERRPYATFRRFMRLPCSDSWELVSAATFCSWTNNSCGCALNSGDKLYNQCQAVCSAWTNKDSDCPDGGCYGFAVKLPQGFEDIKNKPLPPVPTCYPDNNDWNVPFQPAVQNKAGSCFYSMVPAGDFCDNPVPGGLQR